VATVVDAPLPDDAVFDDPPLAEVDPPLAEDDPPLAEDDDPPLAEDGLLTTVPATGRFGAGGVAALWDAVLLTAVRLARCFAGRFFAGARLTRALLAAAGLDDASAGATKLTPPTPQMSIASNVLS
jgi:hypothetical protein